MSFDPERHHRRSIRLPGYDYAQGGAYFVTLCVQSRVCALGEVIDSGVCLSAPGELVAKCWSALPDRFATVLLGELVIMPNHLHGIVFLTEAEAGPHAPRSSLPAIVGAFKSLSTRQINAMHGTAGGFWQRGYYEHIIRSERSLARLQDYIARNPSHWEEDRLHPEADTAW